MITFVQPRLWFPLLWSLEMIGKSSAECRVHWPWPAAAVTALSVTIEIPKGAPCSSGLDCQRLHHRSDWLGQEDITIREDLDLVSFRFVWSIWISSAFRTLPYTTTRDRSASSMRKHLRLLASSRQDRSFTDDFVNGANLVVSRAECCFTSLGGRCSCGWFRILFLMWSPESW